MTNFVTKVDKFCKSLLLTYCSKYGIYMGKSKIKKKEKQMIEFILEPTPMIKLGDMGDIVFSNITSHPTKGYKYVCFRKEQVELLVVKRGNDRKVIEHKDSKSWVVNMQLERRAKSHTQKPLGLPHKAMPGRMKDFIKKTFLPFITDEGYIRYEDMPKLKRKFNRKTVEGIMDKVQKKRPKRRKKKNVDKHK